ncbi:MAG: transcriptional regulator [Gemmatimonadetes bacterium]|nr:transcriptional regulator [Gemmatimonadota bacterium]
MSPTEIRSSLKKRGYLMVDVANECGRTLSAVRNSIYGLPFPSPAIRQHISEILDKPIDAIWPE